MKLARTALPVLLALVLISAPAFARGGHSGGGHFGGGHSRSSGTAGTSSQSRVHVNGYTKKDGTYVAPHDRTQANHSKSDNWSTKGNVNPDTGKKGTKDPNEVKPPVP